jgi:hypothetical protein
MGEIKNGYKILVEKSVRKRHLKILDEVHNIKA